MKKLILPIIILLLLFGGVVFAQEIVLPASGLTPDSPFYFFDTLGEKIVMFFTFGAEKKAEKALKYAEEKLAEAKVMAEKNKINALEKAGQKYREYLNLTIKKGAEAYEQGRDIKELKNLIAEKTLTHLEILSAAYVEVSEQAKAGIEKAIDASREVFEKIVPGIPVEAPAEEIERIEKLLEREQEILYLKPSKPTAKLDFWFSKTEAKVGESIEILISLENVGKKPFPEDDYDLSFTRQEKTLEGWIDYVIGSFEIKGPIEPGQLIERKITLPITSEIESGTYLFQLSFGRIVGREPLETRNIKVLKKEIILIISPPEVKPKVKKEKISLEVCRKGRCVDKENEWFLNECQSEICSCIDCRTFSECWNAWTGKNCLKDEPCRDMFGTDYREAAYNYVYKIDPTKTDKISCLGLEKEE